MVRVTFEPNAAFYNSLGFMPKVTALTKSSAEAVRRQIVATAPVDSGAYRNAITVVARRSRYRNTFRVVGADPKTLIIEARTGTFARALRRVARG